MKKPLSKKASVDLRRISDAAVLAAVLEAGTEKPGNVTPTHDYKDTTYSDYIKGAIALGNAIHESAEKGFRVGETGKG